MEDRNPQYIDAAEKAKALGMISNVHNLSPPKYDRDDDFGKVAIIESLKVGPRLRTMFFEFLGQEFDEETKKVIQVSSPTMNIHGAFRFVKICKRISEECEWSNFSEDEINRRTLAYYEETFPIFTIWHEEFELEPSDFGYVSAVLMSFIDGAFHKGKNAKMINAVTRVYSEDFLGKVMRDSKTDDKTSFISKLNPFRRKK